MIWDLGFSVSLEGDKLSTSATNPEAESVSTSMRPGLDGTRHWWWNSLEVITAF